MAAAAAGEAKGVQTQQLGRYELVGEIASGGMATVYLGRMLGAKGFARLVAIKRLHPHLEKEEEFVTMFLDEARLAARIRHPNCVATLDVEADDGLYIVMEYIEGDRLQSLVKAAARAGGTVPAPIALRIMADALAGLHAAHEVTGDNGEPLNLVHRDVSPQNILIGIDGVARLTDFGIAKAASQLSVTREGQVKGKMAYMAPEQTQGGKIDRRADIFAMGIVAWELFAGRRLFRAETEVETLRMIVSDPIPRLRQGNPRISEALDLVMSRALERDPDKRYSTAAEFALALEEVADAEGGVAPTREVAAYVQKVAGDKLEKERARLKAGIAAASFGDISSTGLSRIGKQRKDGETAAPVEVTSVRGDSARSRMVLYLGAAGLVIGGAALLFSMRARHGDAPATSTAQVRTVVTTPPATPTPEPVTHPPPPAVVVAAPVPVPTGATGGTAGNTATTATTPTAVTTAGTAGGATHGSTRRGGRRHGNTGGNTTTSQGGGTATHGGGSSQGGGDDDIADNPYRH